MKYSLQTSNLSFSYRQQTILNNLNLNIPEGSIYGYLGKNGAGKSTTIKILLGFLQPSDGEVFVEHQNITLYREEALSNIGCLIESPAFYRDFTAFENLKYNSIYYGCSKARILELLDFVGLKDAGSKKVKKFSTGMYQRLALARALLHNPNILILDEPLNGLDPEGVRLFRDIMLQLQREGKTIFLSSHILEEVEKTCTHIGILDNGDLKYEGKLQDLLLSKHLVKLITSESDVSKVKHLIIDNGLTAEFESPTSYKFSINDGEEYNRLVYLLVQNNITIFSLNTQQNHLEDLFLSMTKRTK